MIPRTFPSHRRSAFTSRLFHVSVCLLLLQTFVARATDRHVNPSGGNDGNDGTSAHPWATLGKANATVAVGETVFIHAGTYNEAIAPAASPSSEGQRITYRDYSGDTAFSAHIRGQANVSDGSSVAISGKGYLTIENLDIASNKFDTQGLGGGPGGQGSAKGTYTIDASSTSHVIFENCQVVNSRYLTYNPDEDPIRGGVPERGINLNTSDHSLVENCSIIGWFHAISLGSAATYATVRNNLLENNHRHGIALNNNYQDGTIDGHILIEGNIIGGSLVEDGIQTNPTSTSDPLTQIVTLRKIIIRNNYFYYFGENAVDLKGAGDVVIEGNVFAAAWGDNNGYGFWDDGPTTPVGKDPSGLSVERFGGAVDRGARTASDSVIARKNVFYDNNKGFNYSGPDWKVYNNVFAANTRDYSGWNAAYDASITGDVLTTMYGVGVLDDNGDDYLNNISIDHKFGEIRRVDRTNATLVLDYNIYNNSRPEGLRFIRKTSTAGDAWSDQTVYDGSGNAATAFSDWKSYLAGETTATNMIGKDAHSQVADPLFTNVPRWPDYPYFNFKEAGMPVPPTGNPPTPGFPPVIDFPDLATWFPFDFTLQSGSPAIDAGRALTTANGSGSSSTSLVVANARYFYDGYGMTTGDQVQIGSYSPARIATITAVNYSTNTLTLGTALTWANNDTVNLPYNGTAPDIGAFEYGGGGGGGSAPAAPSGLTATAGTSPLRVDLAWTDNASDETGFTIERKTGSGSFATFATPSTNATSRSDTNVYPGTTYTYHIRADKTGSPSSSWSSDASATTAGSAGPVAAWKFDEGTGTTGADNTGYGNTATISGATWVTAHSGDGLSFDGVDDVADAGHASILNNMTAVTVAAWIKPASMGEGGFGRIVLKGTGTNPSNPTAGFRFLTQGTNQIAFGADFPTTDLSRISTTNVIGTSGSWYHVVATWDGSITAANVKLYVNGTEVGSYATTTNGSGTRGDDSAGDFYIGNDGSGTRTFDGVIDDVQVYNRVLSSTEVSTLYSGGGGTDTVAPTVAITMPSASAKVGGAAVAVSANASDNVGVVGVQFKVDGTNLGSEDLVAPYSVNWNTTGATAGSHTLTAVARDAAGNTTTSTGVAVTVDNTAPTVSMTAPSGGASVRGTTVTVSASASDNIGVVGVQFKIDGANLGAEDTTSGYAITWDSTTATNGSHTLTAVARDAAGNATTSTGVTVTVDNSAPTVSLTAPTASAVVTGNSVTVSASASDNVGVVGVQFKVDGTNIGAEDTGSPFTVSWDSTGSTTGSHTLTAVARDAAGNTTTSSGVSVTVNNTPSVFDANSLTSSDSGEGSSSASDAGATGGAFVLFGGNSTSDWVSFDLTVPYTQTYTVSIRVNRFSNRGIYQLAIDGTNQGTAQDTYKASTADFFTISLGNKALTAGTHTFKFTCTGKNASSSTYKLGVDTITLTPVP